MSTNIEVSIGTLVKAVRKEEKGGYDVIFHNGVNLGRFEYSEDGYLYYWPINRGGCWSSEPMKEIAKLLDSLNEAWDKEVRDGLANLDKIEVGIDTLSK